MREYYKNLYANNFNNLQEMVKFLEWHKLPKFIQEGIDDSNSPLYTEEIEFVIKNHSIKKTPGPNYFIGGFYKISGK